MVRAEKRKKKKQQHRPMGMRAPFMLRSTVTTVIHQILLALLLGEDSNGHWRRAAWGEASFSPELDVPLVLAAARRAPSCFSSHARRGFFEPYLPREKRERTQVIHHWTVFSPSQQQIQSILPCLSSLL